MEIKNIILYNMLQLVIYILAHKQDSQLSYYLIKYKLILS